MTDLISSSQTALANWTSKAINAGWLAPDALTHITALNSATPGQLFTGPERPLVVGFFGGTGVGKSSLMNRLAGEPIARASAERPTSTAITAYWHSSVRVDRLPSDFPLEKLKTVTHDNASYASVLWLDMPDFDSVERSHRQLVEQWLPYIDVLVYVVSPERYRDDEGWRLLLEHGHRHAWLFVINHWDRGDPIQRDDFLSLLNQAGLSDPMVFCTDCNPHQPAVEDDFNQFDQTIRSLADQQFIGELEKLGVFQRLGEIKKTASGLEQALGDAELINRWQALWQTRWAQHSDELTQAIEWQIPNLADQYADGGQAAWLNWLPRILKPTALTTKAPTEGSARAAKIPPLLDDVALQRVDDGVAAFVQDARTEQVHTDALAAIVARRRADLPARLVQTVDQSLHASLQLPGEAWQRALHKSLGWAATLLPIATLGWAGYELITGFAEGGANTGDYLGVNFAVHTAMLTAVAWGVPTLLSHKTKPSRAKAAARGLKQGLNEALAETEHHIADGIEQAGQTRNALLAELKQVHAAGINQLDRPDISDAVKRLLMDAQ